MINHTHKCIFVHIIKTGGMSIATALDMKEKNYHVPSMHIKQNIEDVVWQEYFKFAFVRNPWDKIVSQYHFNGDIFCMRHLGRSVSFAEYVIEIVGKNKLYSMYEPKNLPYIVDAEGGLLVDFIGKFENLQNDFNYVCNKIGVAKSFLPKINQSKHKHYSTYYNNETKNIIAQVFKDDIKYFNYTFDIK